MVSDSEIKSGCCPSGSFGNDDFANDIQEAVFTSAKPKCGIAKTKSEKEGEQKGASEEKKYSI